MSSDEFGKLAQEFTAGQWFRTLVSVPDPAKRVRDLSDEHLDAALSELLAIREMNVYQMDLTASCMAEAIRRWKAGIPRHGGEF